jgi:hypothetical protein
MAEKLFPCNMGRVDRAVRITIGVVLLALTFGGSSYAWGYIGILPLLTGLVGYCPAYKPLGLDTRGHRAVHP